MFSVNSMRKMVINEFPHDLLMNVSEEPLFEGTDRINFPAYVESPYPIHQPLKTTQTDLVKQLLEEKEKYRKLLETKRKRYKFDKKNIVEKKFGNSEYIYLPTHLLEFYQKKDPDPYFDCEYNCYYTNGVLEHMEINSTDYLVRCDAENNLFLNDLREPKTLKVIKSNCLSPIFSIKAVVWEDDQLLVLREKSQVNIVRLVDTEQIEEVLKRNYEVPVFDAKLNRKKRTHLGVILGNGTLSIRDVESSNTILSYKNQNTKTDNFQQFQFLDENNIILMDRFVVKLLDYRMKTEEKVFDPHLINCNTLCNFKIIENNLLLGSRHYLLKADLRYLKDFSYYSHTLREAPCYMDFATKGCDSFLCLANQMEDSKVLFTGESPYTLPFKVPGIQETLRKCILKNSSLVLMDHLKDRLNFSTAGLKVINLDDEVFIYSSNCLGEVFRQKVSDSSPNEKKPIKKLLTFINKLEKPEPVLYLSMVEEMSRARFSLNTKPIERNLLKYKRESKAKEFIETLCPEISKRNVKSNLALDFLAVWDDSEEEEEVDDLPEVAASEKVNDWIQTHDFSDDDNSLGFPLSQLSSL